MTNKDGRKDPGSQVLLELQIHPPQCLLINQALATTCAAISIKETQRPGHIWGSARVQSLALQGCRLGQLMHSGSMDPCPEIIVQLDRLLHHLVVPLVPKDPGSSFGQGTR